MRPVDRQQPIATPDFTESETGRRHPAGIGGRVITASCLLWSLFQLWYASPLPFTLHIGLFNDTEARSIHLAFATFLGYLAFPALKGSPRDRIPRFDWVLAGVAAFSAGYLYLFHESLSQRAGLPTTLDLAVAGAGLLLLLEAARRTLGPPLTVVAGVFLFYTLAGPWMPEVIAHKGASLQRLLGHQWLGTEGVFGVALGVSTGFVFLFVLFGALLEQAGAGHWFINVAYSLLGHLRGGPAKAAVVASGLSGIISGSSIANVVTTGTFTIPLMKRVGFPATKAGAVEVAASTNGQLTPPIMGAAAFLMVEYVGIPYLDVIRHALLPALISYIALLYIVHLEAVKAGMQGVARPGNRWRRLAGLLGGFVFTGLFAALVILVLGWLHGALGVAGPVVLALLGLFAYVGLVAWSAGVPSPEEAPPLENGLPPLLPTLRSGLYFLLPVAVLIWCLAVARLSPGLAAFWGTCFMMLIVITHRPLRRLFRAVGTAHAWHAGLVDLRDALVHGARNMIGIGVATAAAGIVVGTVTLTGIGLVMTEFVSFVSGGNLLLMLLFTALISLVLGMGLPTTANYIVVSTLMAPVIVELGAEHGLVVPLIAVHLFVFYFGILADDTPPVGLAAFAAAAIAKADPIKTGIQGFMYDIRTAILPFMFIFNTELLLIGITSLWHLALTVAAAIGAMLCFAAATQGFWLTRSRWWESVALALAAFSLFRPGFWWDQVYPPQVERPPAELVALAGQAPVDGRLQVRAAGRTLEGEAATREVSLPLGAVAEGMRRLEDAGLFLRRDGDGWLVDGVTFGSPAQQAGLDLDWRIEAVVVDSDRPDKQWVYAPVVGLVLLLAWGQRRRLAVEVSMRG